jgi:hypothetical protein
MNFFLWDYTNGGVFGTKALNLNELPVRIADAVPSVKHLAPSRIPVGCFVGSKWWSHRDCLSCSLIHSKLFLVSHVLCVLFVKINLPLYLTTYQTMKTHGGQEEHPHAFLTSALDTGEWSASRSASLPPGKEAPVWGWFRPGSGPDAVAKRKEIPAPAGNRTPVAQSVS